VVTTRMVSLCVSARESSPLAVNEPIAESVLGRLTKPPHRNHNRLAVPTGNPDDLLLHRFSKPFSRPNAAELIGGKCCNEQFFCLHCIYAIMYIYNMNTKQQASKLSLRHFKAEMTDMWPLAKGSLAQVHNSCIRPDCPACASGKKHRAFIFSYIKKGRRRCMYVPLELVAELRKAIRNGRLLEARMSGLGSELILRFRQQQSRSKSTKNTRGKTR